MPVYKDKTTNTWYFTFKKTINGNIFTRKKRGFRTKQEALKGEYETIEEISRSNFLIPTDKKSISLNDIINMFLISTKGQVKVTTYASKVRKINSHITPYFNNIKICNLAHTDIIKWRENIISKKWSEDHSNKLLYLLKDILTYAYNYGYLKDNTLTLELKHIQTTSLPIERDIWIIDEFEKFINTFDTTSETQILYRDYFECLFDTGLRPNEFRALQVKDLEGNYINVDKTINSKDGKEFKNEDILLPPKNKSSIRKVLLTQNLVNILKYRCEGKEPHQFIFGGDRALRETNIHRYLKRHSELANINKITLYGFRHSHATILINENVPIKVVSKRLGHSSIATTMDTYYHLYKEHEELATDAIDFVRNKPKVCQKYATQ